MKKNRLQSLLNKLAVQQGSLSGGLGVLKGGTAFNVPVSNTVCTNRISNGGSTNTECVNTLSCEDSTSRQGCTDPMCGS